MDWMEAVVHTTTMGADLISEVLMNAGAVGTSIEDRYDVTSSKKSDGMWDMIDEEVLAHMSEDVLVKAYFKNDASAQETLMLVGEKQKDLLRQFEDSLNGREYERRKSFGDQVRSYIKENAERFKEKFDKK